MRNTLSAFLLATAGFFTALAGYGQFQGILQDGSHTSSAREGCEGCRMPLPSAAEQAQWVKTVADADLSDWNPTYTIDFLCAFDPDAEEWAKAKCGTLEAYGEHVVKSMNNVMRNSGLDGQFRLAGTYVIGTNVPEIVQGVSIAMNDMGLTNAVKAAQADVTILFAAVKNSARSESGDAAYEAKPGHGYACVTVENGYGALTAIHEAGHIMGCNHSRDVDREDVHPYAYGATRIINGTQYTTVMGYYGVRLAHFSSPDYYVEGVAMGSETENNCRRISERLPEVARLGDRRYTYEISQTEYFFNEYGHTFSVDLRGMKAYRISSDSEWLRPAISSGWVEEPFNVEVWANDTNRPRVGHIVVSDFDKANPSATMSENSDGLLGDVVITVTQLANGTVAVLPERCFLAADGTGKDVRFFTETSFQIVSDIPEWLKLNTTKGTGGTSVHVSATPNNTDVPRVAVLTVSSGFNGYSTSFLIQQDAQGQPTLNTDLGSIESDYRAQNFTLNITANTTYTVTSSQPSWLTPQFTKGTGDGQLIVSLTTNTGDKERTATLTLTPADGTGQPVVINVKQASGQGGSQDDTGTFKLDTYQLKASSKAQDCIVKLTTKSSFYTKVDDGSWLSVDPAKGEGTTSLTLTLKANDTGKERTNVLTISNEKGTVSVKLTVTQSAGGDAPKPVAETLEDGKPYAAKESHTCEELTYTRQFEHAEWQALYIPFAMDYKEWSDKLDVAEIYNILQYDENEDGVFEKTTLVILHKKSGSIVPNRPYMVRPKSAGLCTLQLQNKTLLPAESHSIDCSSTYYVYTFTGIYDGLEKGEMASRSLYGMNGGNLLSASASASLAPQRWYMSITPREGADAKVRPAQINIMAIDEDSTEGIMLQSVASGSPADAAAYDLQGRRLIPAASSFPAHKGLLIQNGKKIIR